MIKTFVEGKQTLFFPVRWANSVTRWIIGLYSKTGTIDIDNTTNPNNGKGCSIDVNVDVVLNKTTPELDKKYLQKSNLLSAIGDLCDETLQIKNGTLGLKKEIEEEKTIKYCAKATVSNDGRLISIAFGTQKQIDENTATVFGAQIASASQLINALELSNA